MNFIQLQRGNVEAWTYLIRRNKRLQERTVTQVDLSMVTNDVQRAMVTLATQQDPLAFLVYRTTAATARFLKKAGPQLSFIVPHIWFIDEAGENKEEPGVIIEDIEPSVPNTAWPLSDLDQLAEQLATLHATFWDPAAADYRWLPFALNRGSQNNAGDNSCRPDELDPHQPPLNKKMGRTDFQAIEPTIVQKTHDLWPDLLSVRHLQAAKHLLRDPALLQRPLLTLPLTVLHGQPTLNRWRLTLFGNSYLLDWQQAALGPAVLDLDLLLFSIPDEPRPDRAGRLSPWKTASESFLDSYFLALSEALHERHGYGVAYSSRYMRRFALPAARCWLVLNHHLPSLLAVRESATQEAAKSLWKQFLDSYRLLTTYVKGMSEIDIRPV